jgi:tripartite-type tricarboxylate transporter receptor subunit TctC
MFVPLKTPPRLIALLNREVIQVLNRHEIRDLLFRDGTEVIGSSPDEFAASIKAELASLGQVIRAAGIRAQ